MNASAQQIGAAVILFLALCAPITRPLLRPFTKGRSDFVAALLWWVFATITFTAGALIAEWWALAVAFVAVLSGIPMLHKLDTEDERPGKAVQILGVAGFAVLELLPVTLGVILAR